MKRFIKYFFICTLFIGLLILSTSYAYTKDEWNNMVKADLQVLKDKGVLGSDFNLNNQTGPDFPNLIRSYYIFIGSGFSHHYSGTSVMVAWCRGTYAFNHTNDDNDLYYIDPSNNGKYAVSDCNLYRADNGQRYARGGFNLKDSNLIYVYAAFGSFEFDEYNISLSAGEEWRWLLFN